METSRRHNGIHSLGPSLCPVRASVDLGNGHHITSDFPDIHIATEGNQGGQRNSAALTANEGGVPMLKVRTTSADLFFRRANQ